MTRARLGALAGSVALLAVLFDALSEGMGTEVALAVLARIVGVTLLVAAVGAVITSVLVAILVTGVIAAAAGDLDEVGW